MPSNDSNYGNCLCKRCNGKLRRRITITAHENRPAFIKLPQHRFCYCSQHPLGELVHRHTRRRHRAQDELRNVDEQLVPDIDITEYLADRDNAGATRASVINMIRHERALVADAQYEINNPECDESLEEDAADDLLPALDEEDPDTRDRLEEEEAMASEASSWEEPLHLNGTRSIYTYSIANYIQVINWSSQLHGWSFWTAYLVKKLMRLKRS